jgi:phage shock protein PspC (stress-responsive transcriptional regulator)/predicted membrane protein
MGTETRLLRRSRADRTLAGVCAGLAAYFEIHPAIFRVAFVVLTLLGGAGLAIYLAAILVMPDEGQDDSIATSVLRARRDRPLVLIVLGVLTVAIGSMLSEATLPWGDVWLILFVAGGVILWITLGVVREGAHTARRRLGVAAGSIVAVMLVAIAIFSAVLDVHFRYGLGDRRYAVSNPQDLLDEYRLGGGDLRIDLRSIRLPPGRTRVVARNDVGTLRVIVPDDVALRVRARARLGRVDLLGEVVEGWHVESRLAQRGARVLVLDTEVGVGTLEIRAVR